MHATWSAMGLALGACFTASPLVGVPCDPAAPRCPDGQACIAGANGFVCLPEGTPPVIDAAPAVPSCPDDADLIICFDFDAPTLASPLANQGRASVSAELVNVTRIANGAGGAANVGSSSTIFIDAHPALVDVTVLEASLRLDVGVPDGMRVGIIDSPALAVAGFSVFVYGAPNGEHQLRCTVGAPELFVDLATAVGTWVSVACVCDVASGVAQAFVDGEKRGEIGGCEPGSAHELGLQIGQNSRADDNLPPDEPLIGAIDDVRLRGL